MEGEDSRPVKLTFYKLENTWENGDFVEWRKPV